MNSMRCTSRFIRGSFAVLFLGAAMFALPCFFREEAKADQYASREQTNAAVGHYARARALLVEALAEFEAGRRIARPDMLLDSEEWRLNVISRTEELNRLLDPQPRVTRGGARFSASRAMIRRERQRVPRPQDGARDTNTYGEEQFLRERAQQQRVPLTEPAPASRNTPDVRDRGRVDVPAQPERRENIAPQNIPIPDSVPDTEQLPGQPDVVEDEPEFSAPVVDSQDELQGGEPVDTEAMSEEDEAVAKAIEEAIQRRLERLNESSGSN